MSSVTHQNQQSRRRATPPPSRYSTSPQTRRRPAAWRRRKKKRMALLRTIDGGGRSTSLEPERRRAKGAAEEEEQQDGGRLGFNGARKAKFKQRRPPPPFIGRARLFGKPAIRQAATLRETRNPTVRRPSTVTSKTPAEPLRARAASPPSSDVFAAAAGLTETRRAGTPFAGFGTLTKACGDVFPRRGLVQSQGPRAIWPIVTGPAWPPLYYGPNL
jgi:hypothetical protein